MFTSFEMVTFVYKYADDLLTLPANSNGRKLQIFLGRHKKKKKWSLNYTLQSKIYVF